MHKNSRKFSEIQGKKANPEDVLENLIKYFKVLIWTIFERFCENIFPQQNHTKAFTHTISDLRRNWR